MAIHPSGMPLTYDVAIVGGGPAGLSAAMMLGRACRRVILIDAGHPRNAAAQELHGFLGRDGTSPRDLLRDSRKELAKYLIEVVDDCVVVVELMHPRSDAPLKTTFRVATRGGRIVMCRKVLFATGVCDKIPDLPGFGECYGISVHHCPYCDGWEHRGKRLVAFGGQASAAIGLAMALRGWSDQVLVLTNGAQPPSDAPHRLTQNGIVLDQRPVRRLTCKNGQLTGIELEDGDVLAADALFFNTEQRAGCELPAQLGCETDEMRRGRTGDRQNTRVPGVFLAGDADGDVQFAIVAAAEGATAGVAINRELQDEDRL